MERDALHGVRHFRLRAAAHHDTAGTLQADDLPGKPGSLTTLEGDDVYDDLTLTATCFIRDPALIPSIAAWLKGGGTVTFANRPGGFYHARVSNQIPFEKILRGNPHRSFAVNFRCSPPFW